MKLKKLSDEKYNGEGIQDPNKLQSVATQTVDAWPKPYEHLFLDLFPTSEASNFITNTVDTQVSSGPSPAPSNIVRFSPYDMLDKYIETSKQSNERDLKYQNKNYEIEVKGLKEQLELVHLQVHFERHRRDVHAERNRRLMGKAKSNRALEEHNNALVSIKMKNFFLSLILCYSIVSGNVLWLLIYNT